MQTANVLLKPPEAEKSDGDDARSSVFPQRAPALSSATSVDSVGGDHTGSGSGSFSSSGAGARSSASKRKPRWRAVLADFGEYVDVRNPHEPLAHRLEKQRGGTPHYKVHCSVFAGSN